MLGKGLESLIPPLRQGSEGQAPPHQGSPPSPEVTEGHSEGQAPPRQNSNDDVVQKPEVNPEESSLKFNEAESVSAEVNSEGVSLDETSNQEEIYTEGETIESTENETPLNEVSEVPAQGDLVIFQIEIDKIKPNPHQPRKYFDEESLRELAVSIREFGIIQPLVVSKMERESEQGWSVHYELIAGERRLMASKLVGLPTVPAIIRSEPKEREKLEIAVVENIQRADLNAIELARAIARLQDEFGLTQREVAARLGKSRGAVANTVRLLGLPSEIQESIANNKLTESHARLLLQIDDNAMQDQIFQDILRENLSVRETDERIKRIRINAVKGKEYSVARNLVDPEIALLKERLEEFLGTKVDLQSRGKSGKNYNKFLFPRGARGNRYKSYETKR